MAADIGMHAEQSALHKMSYFFLVAIFFFSFLSKAGMNIFNGFLFLASFLLLWRAGLEPLRAYPWWVFIVIPLSIGLLVSPLTLAGGVEETGHFLSRFKFFLLPIAIVLVAHDRKAFLNLFIAVWVSALLATLYGLSHAEQRVMGGFHGIHFILRNADMLIVVILTMMVFLLDRDFYSAHKKWVWLMWPSLLLFGYGLVMSASRGSWLGFFIGILAFAVFFYRRLLVVIFVVAVAVVMFANDSKFFHEAESMAELEADHSNSARLQLWRSGWDFSLDHFWLGAGHSQVEPLFLDFFYSKPADYQEKYNLASQYPWDFHNSYLQILVEWGALYFIALAVGGIVLFFKLYQSLSRVSPSNRYFVKAAIVVSVGYLAAQFFHNELYGYGTVIYLLLLTSGLSAVSWQGNESEAGRRDN